MDRFVQTGKGIDQSRGVAYLLGPREVTTSRSSVGAPTADFMKRKAIMAIALNPKVALAIIVRSTSFFLAKAIAWTMNLKHRLGFQPFFISCLRGGCLRLNDVSIYTHRYLAEYHNQE
jgi:hypothetical protein